LTCGIRYEIFLVNACISVIDGSLEAAFAGEQSFDAMPKQAGMGFIHINDMEVPT